MITGGGERDINGRTGLTWKDIKNREIKRNGDIS